MATRKTFWPATTVKPVVVIGHLIVPQLHHVLEIYIAGRVFARCLAVYVLSIVIVVGVVLRQAGGEAVEEVLSKSLQCQVVFLWKSTDKQRGAINDTFGGKHRKAVETSSALVNCEVVSLQSVYMEHSGLKHSTIFLHKIFFVQCYEPIFYWRTRLSYSYVSIPFSSCQLLKGQLSASSSCDDPQLPGDQTLKETLELQV